MNVSNGQYHHYHIPSLSSPLSTLSPSASTSSSSWKRHRRWQSQYPGESARRPKNGWNWKKIFVLSVCLSSRCDNHWQKNYGVRRFSSFQDTLQYHCWTIIGKVFCDKLTICQKWEGSDLLPHKNMYLPQWHEIFVQMKKWHEIFVQMKKWQKVFDKIAKCISS